MSLGKKEPYVTVAEFDAMEKEEQYCYELFQGEVMMSPRPTRRHSEIASRIFLRNLCISEVVTQI